MENRHRIIVNVGRALRLMNHHYHNEDPLPFNKEEIEFIWRSSDEHEAGVLHEDSLAQICELFEREMDEWAYEELKEEDD